MIIDIELDEKFAEDLSAQISDWLCWVGGVKWATRNDDSFDFIPDTDTLRELNIKLKNKIHKPKKAA